MILLTSTSDLVQVVTGGTQNTQVHASYVDLNATTGATTPGRLNTILTSVATTTVVGSPSAGVTRNLKNISVRNTDASNAITVTIQHTDGTNVVVLCSASLPAGSALTWTYEGGWVLTDANGATA